MPNTRKETSKVKKEGKSKKWLIILAVVVVVLGVGLKLGYQKIKEKISEILVSRMLSKSTEGEVKVADGGKTVSYKGEDGEFKYEGENKLVEGFPQDFPAYPGATLLSSWSAKTESNEGTSAIWESTAELSKVSSFYKESLVQKGWEVTTTLDQPDFVTLTIAKGKDKGILALAVNEGKVTISITFGIE